MVGSYDDVPATRLAWDADGTEFFTIDSGGSITTRTTEEAEIANNENGDTVVWSDFGTNYFGLIFPHLVDLAAYYVRLESSSAGLTAGAVQTSDDTTNGQDGTWTQLTPTWTTRKDTGTDKPAYRTAITTAVAAGIKAIRWISSAGGSNQLAALHVYGAPSAPLASKLVLWDAVADAEITDPAFFDFGDVVREETPTKQFRVKNTSTDYRALLVEVLDNNLGNVDIDGTSDWPSALVEFELDGVEGYSSSVELGDLEPEAISDIITVRFSPSATIDTGLLAWRIEATPTGDWEPV
jgi:hypothetical protein